MDTPKIFYPAAAGAWFAMLVVAFVFGALREFLINPLAGKQAGHVIGSLLVVACFLTIIYFFVRHFHGSVSPGAFWVIGIGWLMMTVSFEFLFFHYIGGKPWSELLADYNVAKGRIWPLVLLTTLFGPPAIDALLRR